MATRLCHHPRCPVYRIFTLFFIPLKSSETNARTTVCLPSSPMEQAAHSDVGRGQTNHPIRRFICTDDIISVFLIPTMYVATNPRQTALAFTPTTDNSRIVPHIHDGNINTFRSFFAHNHCCHDDRSAVGDKSSCLAKDDLHTSITPRRVPSCQSNTCRSS